jgi:hypothetical protein
MFTVRWGGNMADITKFLGEHISLTGDTNLMLGELSKCENAKITQDYKVRKREGYKELFESLGSHRIQGQWNGYINGSFFHLFACNGHLYKTVAGVNTDLGTLTDAPTNFFYFGTKLYIQNRNEYKSFDGTTLIDVAGYIPNIRIGTPPTGGGTSFENINLLTGKKHQTFSSDGVATAYTIAESLIDSIDKVYVNGVLKTVITDYTVNLVTGVVTFLIAPIIGQDNVDIYWTKGIGSRSEVTGYSNALLFGGSNDTRVHLYGNGTNIITFSGLADGVPSAEYFPALNTSSIGSSQFAITSLLKQYDRMIISTTGSSYYSTYDFTNNIASFPVYPLNDKVGNVALGQGQIIQNNPFIITNGVWEIVASSVRDERNVVNKSNRVKALLDGLNLSTAITLDYEDLKEYWLCIGNKAYIYNYGNDTWYHYILADTPTCFTVIGGKLYMGTTNGQIMQWAQYTEVGDVPDYLTDNGTTINTTVETGFIDFGISYKRKFLNFAWVAMQPETRSVCFVEWETDYDASTDPEIIYYSLVNFEDIEFDDFSFNVNYNPQPFRLKLKAKKFVFFKLILTNDSDTETMTILSVNLPAIVGGNVK